jgi:hypothetical protein
VVDDRSIKANDSTSLQTFIVAHREVSTTDVAELVEFLARGACSSGMQECRNPLLVVTHIEAFYSDDHSQIGGIPCSWCVQQWNARG